MKKELLQVSSGAKRNFFWKWKVFENFSGISAVGASHTPPPPANGTQNKLLCRWNLKGMAKKCVI
jgi:hypothetical protein